MKDPEITRIDIYRYAVGSLAPITVALGTLDSLERILVRIHSSDGLYGLGEGCPIWFIAGETPATAFEAAKTLSGMLVGKNPLQIEVRMRELDAFLVHNSTVKSAIDMALYDLLAKRAGLPLYAVLGGEKRSLHTDKTVGIGDPAVMAQKALSIKNEGYRAVKVKLGTGRTEDVARIREIRAAVGDDLSIRVDANQGWDPTTAVLVLRDLEKFDIQFCEQPVAHWDDAALRRVREQSPIPIMADESLFDHHDAFRLASMGACDYFNIKLAKSGGIHTALKINAIAEGAGIRCMAGCMAETRLGLSAAAHLVSARPNIVFADLDSSLLLSEDRVVGGIEFEGGQITLPDAPGHGADFEPGLLRGLESCSVGQ